VSTFRALTGDPGTKNFAASVVEYDGKNLRVLGTKMIEHAFANLSGDDAVERLYLFTKEYRGLIKEFKPNAQIFERFQVRGKNTSIIEGINVMLGSILHQGHMYDLPTRLIMAATWKNNFNKNNASGASLEELYKTLKLTSKFSPKAIHEFDASLIGVYATYLHNSQLKPFTGFDPLAFHERFINAPNL